MIYIYYNLNLTQIGKISRLFSHIITLLSHNYHKRINFVKMYKSKALLLCIDDTKNLIFLLENQIIICYNKRYDADPRSALRQEG